MLRTLPADDQVYAALTGGVANLNLPLPREGNMGNILDALKSVESATLGMNLSKGIDAVAVVNCKTAGDAKFIHDLFRGLIGFGRLNTPDNQPEMLKLYDSIQVTQQETQTKVAADVPAGSDRPLSGFVVQEITATSCRPALESRRPGSSIRRLR